LVEAVKELKTENDVLKERLDEVYKKVFGWDTFQSGTDPHIRGSFCARILEYRKRFAYDDFPRHPCRPAWNAGIYGSTFCRRELPD
jgi:hypothetical protein